MNITGLIAGTYDDAANVIDLGTPNIVTPALWNAVTSLPANEQYSFLFTQQFGAIQAEQRIQTELLPALFARLHEVASGACGTN